MSTKNNRSGKFYLRIFTDKAFHYFYCVALLCLSFTASIAFAQTCSLGITSTSVAVGSSTTLSLTGTNLPAGAQGYWNGTLNGVTDITNVSAGVLPVGINLPNNGGTVDNTYMRFAVVKDTGGTTICTSNAVTFTFLKTPVPTCSLSITSTSVAVGSSTTLSLSGTNLPAGSQGYWNGTLNGVTDITNVSAGVLPVGINLPNNGGTVDNTYMRFAVVKDTGGTTICTSNAVTFTFLKTPVPAPTCSLGITSTSVPAGSATTLSLSGTNLPAGAQGYWNGTLNGVTDITSVSAGVLPVGITLPNNGGTADSTYTRFAVVKNTSGTTICTTSSVTFTFLKTPPPAPACAISITSTSVPVGSSTTLSLSGTNLPTGAQGYWGGTVNGVTDITNVSAGVLPVNITLPNSGSATDLTYTRFATVKDTGGTTVCTTGPVTFTFLKSASPATCSLNITSTTIAVGSSTSLSLIGTNVPTGAQAYWSGTLNGSPDITNVLGGALPLTVNLINNGGATDSVFIRTATIKDVGGNALCTSNSVSFTFTKGTATPCTLSVSATNILPGSSTTLTISGTTFPTGAQAYWNGTLNGTTDITSVAAGVVPLAITLPNNGVTTNSAYMRYAVINDASGALFCTTNQVNFAFLKSAGISYVYDALGRLRRAIYTSGTVIDYTYDAAGNRSTAVTGPTN